MRLDDTAPEGAVLIPLCARDGAVRAYAIVDAEDADFVNQWRWSLGSNGYVHRGTCRAGGVQRTYRLHREIMGLVPGDGLEVDHINRNRLDNRRSNLRVATRMMNAQNTSGQRKSTSPYRGVHWAKHIGKWVANVKIDGRTRNLGCFEDELEAARVARQARLAAFPYAVD